MGATLLRTVRTGTRFAVAVSGKQVEAVCLSLAVPDWRSSMQVRHLATAFLLLGSFAAAQEPKPENATAAVIRHSRMMTSSCLARFMRTSMSMSGFACW
jgi:hypothetical protein